MSTEKTISDISQDTEYADEIQVISFSNRDLEIVQNIVIIVGTTLDNIVEGLNLGSLTTTLSHGEDSAYIVDTTGNQVATIVSQDVTVTGTDFSNYMCSTNEYEEVVIDVEED